MDNMYPLGVQMPVWNMDYVPPDMLAHAASKGGGPLKQYFNSVVYDSVIFPPATALVSSQVSLFQNRKGTQQALYGSATQVTKNLNDTNITAQGQLPLGQYFLIRSIQCAFNITVNAPTIATSGANLDRPTGSGFSANISSAASDLRSFLGMSHCTFEINQSTFQEGPMMVFPTDKGVQFNGFGIGATTGQTLAADGSATNGLGIPWIFDPDCEILVVSQQPFEFNIDFPNSFTTPANAWLQLWVFLQGRTFNTIR